MAGIRMDYWYNSVRGPSVGGVGGPRPYTIDYGFSQLPSFRGIGTAVTYHSKSLFGTPCCQSQFSTLHGSLVRPQSTAAVEEHHRNLKFTFYMQIAESQIYAPLLRRSLISQQLRPINCHYLTSPRSVRDNLSFFQSCAASMISQRLVQRTAPRSSYEIPSRLLRNTFQRRFASSGEPPLTGAADNAFNRERRAVKQHAAASSGE